MAILQINPNNIYLDLDKKTAFIRAIVADILVDDLGTYETNDGVFELPVTVTPHNQRGDFYPLEFWKKKGLEVVIKKGEERSILGHRGADRKRYWEITLRYWRDSENTVVVDPDTGLPPINNPLPIAEYNLLSAKDKVVGILTQAETPFILDPNYFVPANKKLGVPASLMIKVWDRVYEVPDATLVEFTPIIVTPPTYDPALTIVGVGTAITAIRGDIVSNPPPFFDFISWYKGQEFLFGADTYITQASDVGFDIYAIHLAFSPKGQYQLEGERISVV